tara:strand:- start:236 stop:691 length:456 start_codon:yes stop_codon:yes gene_type:complete
MVSSLFLILPNGARSMMLRQVLIMCSAAMRDTRARKWRNPAASRSAKRAKRRGRATGFEQSGWQEGSTNLGDFPRWTHSGSGSAQISFEYSEAFQDARRCQFSESKLSGSEGGAGSDGITSVLHRLAPRNMNGCGSVSKTKIMASPGPGRI